jgi:hypothetical protein
VVSVVHVATGPQHREDGSHGAAPSPGLARCGNRRSIANTSRDPPYVIARIVKFDRSMPAGYS